MEFAQPRKTNTEAWNNVVDVALLQRLAKWCFRPGISADCPPLTWAVDRLRRYPHLSNDDRYAHGFVEHNAVVTSSTETRHAVFKRGTPLLLPRLGIY